MLYKVLFLHSTPHSIFIFSSVEWEENSNWISILDFHDFTSKKIWSKFSQKQKKTPKFLSTSRNTKKKSQGKFPSIFAPTRIKKCKKENSIKIKTQATKIQLKSKTNSISDIESILYKNAGLATTRFPNINFISWYISLVYHWCITIYHWVYQ